MPVPAAENLAWRTESSDVTCLNPRDGIEPCVLMDIESKEMLTWTSELGSAATVTIICARVVIVLGVVSVDPLAVICVAC